MTTIAGAMHEHQGAVSALIAAEIRAEMGRQGVSMREMARRLPASVTWVTRRIGARSAEVELTVDEVALMAKALGVPPQGLLTAWLPRLDSNQQPSGYPSPQVSDDDDWVLAA